VGWPVRIGMIGCGAIARQYLDTARRLDAIEIVAAADRVPARATAVEAAEGIPRCRSPTSSRMPRWMSS
jgi:predicted dehydrogenase